jgi:penicillin-binding protein A
MSVARRIRWLGAAMLLCFAVLLGALTYIQVDQGPSLATKPDNPAVIAKRYDQPRGVIQSANGVILAESVPPHEWFVQVPAPVPGRTALCPHRGLLVAKLRATGVESSYDQYLSAHTEPIMTIGDLLTTTTVTDSVTLTLTTTLQQDAVTALGGRDGAIVVLDPTIGAIKAMYSNPTFDPNPLAVNNATTEALAYETDNTRNPVNGFAPAVSLAYQDIFPPGSNIQDGDHRRHL